MSANKFEYMIGKEFTYCGKVYLVKAVSYNESEGQYEVETDGKMIKETEAGMSMFVENQTLALQTDLSVSIRRQDADLTAVGSVLMSVLKDVQKDPKKIDQARAVSETAQTIINLKKLQLDVIKTANVMRNKK